MKDYYKILEVSENATKDDIKKSFKRLAKKYHPDINKDNKEAEQKFKEISEAYEVLGKEDERKKYDSQRKGWGRYNFTGFSQNGPFDEFFKDYRKRYGGDSKYTNTKGKAPDLGDVWDYIFNGDDDSSDGDSTFSSIFGKVSDIFGNNEKKKTASTTNETKSKTQTTANNTTRSKNKNYDYVLTVPLEKAVSGGYVMVNSPESTSIYIHPGAANEDILLANGYKYKLVIQASEPFVLNGNNIETTVCINIVQAVLGSKIRFKAPNGQNLIVTVPAGSNNGTKLKFAGMGLAGGDLFVIIEVLIPKNIDSNQEAEFKKLAQVMNWRY